MADEKGNETVAFLGPVASYTHQATLSVLQDSTHDIKPLPTIEDVFAAVQSGTASRGVVPFENSSNGSVVFTLDLFADLHGRYPDILVCGETYLAVRHCLLGHVSKDHTKRALDTAHDASGATTPTQATPSPQAPRAKPLHDLRGIKKLYSHPQAWGQCKLFLSTYLKGTERQDVSSTSKAAELVSQDPSGTSAAISSKIASQINNLDLLAEGIEDNEGNSTRFLIIRHKSSAPSPSPSSKSDSDHKTLMLFTLEHGQPGALASCLEVFKKHDLNLTSINTRPSGEAAWHYIFFVEFMGRKLEDGKDGAVNAALLELGTVAKGWRWLGSWENALTGR